MPRPKKPTYSLHKPSGQAITRVRVNGKRQMIYLGKYNSQESKDEYRSPYDQPPRPRRTIRFHRPERDPETGKRISVEYIKRTRYIRCDACRKIFRQSFYEPTGRRPSE